MTGRLWASRIGVPSRLGRGGGGLPGWTLGLGSLDTCGPCEAEGNGSRFESERVGKGASLDLAACFSAAGDFCNFLEDRRSGGVGATFFLLD